MPIVERRYQHLLADLADRSMLRTLRIIESAQEPKVIVDGQEYLLLCSNNYLGLANHPALIEASVRATRDFGAGSGASRLVSGSMKHHHQLEERIAEFKGTEAALVFNSGYAANTGILQGLLGPDDVIFSDSLNHASIIDGCRLSQAKVVVYPHNNVAALRALMEQEERGADSVWLVVTDGVFSMDGDVAPLAELSTLKDQFNALLMVDDAHGTGVLGSNGRGTAEAAGCLGKIDLHMGTLGKALGSFGAFLAGKRVFVDTLINRSRSFIFSTSLPPGVLAAGMEAFDIVDSIEGQMLRQNLELKRQRVSSRLLAAGADILGSTSQIIPVLTRDPEPTMRFAGQLLDESILLQGIRPPTVPVGTCRLRATLMATHDDADLDRAVDAVIACLDISNG